MDNPTRSERSRRAALQAALTIIARDGPGQLTFDAMSRESGISKGGLMHQFRTKTDVLKALLEHDIAHFENFSQRYLAQAGDTTPEANLAAEIATMREAAENPQAGGFAVLAALVEDPTLLSVTKEMSAQKVKRIKAEAADPDLALLRWSAARGLVFTTLLGLSPLSEKERGRLFDRLLDDSQWPAAAETKTKPRAARAPRAVKKSSL
ncbi:TetR/AcrR family transcriptional regulator [Paraburkholderia sp. 22099]|jgi:AcrR family transcriptional regulator|uniref:AcrR family transcriptional regulator n=1 Tax=Paraburkholderia terricola TaxID=169427 RepID=A0A1M6NL62_9BURK|nr:MULTISPECIES: TetR/AcrR family transcriptional regulator [Paraburkholderia]ORC52272.1 TetR family transcriptional regulator [Burkholderia sp. A27]AXE95210.1 TetR/AcrR family transcriptional regulator [Paraburkholderia terricola]MDR6410143.1 AcrR family transcriptional regulator [Paraburkholderia terricola]MDR6444013.1 AcrR family transcriptional regulator [Paraburkholderia terricola]MDR6481303.1 AcrR family transcriptional regulator [Paraburkholderia terricola]